MPAGRSQYHSGTGTFIAWSLLCPAYPFCNVVQKRLSAPTGEYKFISFYRANMLSVIAVGRHSCFLGPKLYHAYVFVLKIFSIPLR